MAVCSKHPRKTIERKNIIFALNLQIHQKQSLINSPENPASCLKAMIRKSLKTLVFGTKQMMMQRYFSRLLNVTYLCLLPLTFKTHTHISIEEQTHSKRYSMTRGIV